MRSLEIAENLCYPSPSSLAVKQAKHPSQGDLEPTSYSRGGRPLIRERDSLPGRGQTEENRDRQRLQTLASDKLTRHTTK